MPTRQPSPPYRAVAEQLRARIAAGEFGESDRLPSGRLLAEEYGVAPNTILSAIGVLRDEGLVVSEQGRGTFVRRGTPSPPRFSPEFAAISAYLDEVAMSVRALSERVAKLESTARRRSGRRPGA